MDAFQKAREKYAKNRANNERHHPEVFGIVPPPVAEVAPAIVPEVPKEKPRPNHEAIFEVNVSLPDREFTLVLTKRNIYGNISPHRMTKDAVRGAIREGLMKIIGDVE